MRMPDGRVLPSELRPNAREAAMTGEEVMHELVSRVDAEAAEHRGITVITGCSAGCKGVCASGALNACHDEALVERLAQLQADRHAATVAAAAHAHVVRVNRHVERLPSAPLRVPPSGIRVSPAV